MTTNAEDLRELESTELRGFVAQSKRLCGEQEIAQRAKFGDSMEYLHTKFDALPSDSEGRIII